MKISLTIDIHCTPQVVFGWLEKPDKARMWMTSVSQTEIVHETPERVGTTFREIVQDQSGSVEMSGVITAFEQNKTIAFHLDSKVNTVDVAYSIEQTTAGVHLAQDANVRWKFPVNVFSVLFGNKIRQNILAQTQDEFQKLKKLCEDPPIANCAQTTSQKRTFA